MEATYEMNTVFDPELLAQFKYVRAVTEDLINPLGPEDFIISVTEDTSPPKWHLAHTTWFFENFILKRFNPDYRPYNVEFHFLFNSYYKAEGNFLPKNKRNTISRPTIEEVLWYREAVTNEVISLVHRLGSTESKLVRKILEIGIHHEQQHQELLMMDIKRNFFENPMKPAYQASLPKKIGEKLQSHWIPIEKGLYQVGVGKYERGFSYDNEREGHSHWLDSYALCSHLVSNGDFLAFIEAGGYQDPLRWLSDGWDWKEREGIKHPLYWEKEGNQWFTMSLSGMVPLELEAPLVHISYYEAQAYAHWKGCRLPTEFEWEVAAGLEDSYGSFLEDFEMDAGAGVSDHALFSHIHGTVWEWTQSAYLPYPRYQAFDQGLSEYNEKFMCNQFVLRGGSAITPRSHYRVTYRNFYYPHMRWQYAGLRLAKDLL